MARLRDASGPRLGVQQHSQKPPMSHEPGEVSAVNYELIAAATQFSDRNLIDEVHTVVLSSRPSAVAALQGVNAHHHNSA